MLDTLSAYVGIRTEKILQAAEKCVNAAHHLLPTCNRRRTSEMLAHEYSPLKHMRNHPENVIPRTAHMALARVSPDAARSSAA